MVRKRKPPTPVVKAKANIFQMQKVSLCGNQIKRESVKYLTLAECDDTDRFPLGPQKDRIGTYVWQRSLAGG